MPATAIRRADQDEAPAIRAVARASWHAAYDDFLGPDTVEAVIDDWYTLEGLRRSIVATDAHVFVAAPTTDSSARDGAPNTAGFIHVGPWPSADPGPDVDGGRSADDESSSAVAKLTRLYVHPAHWGQGLGTALLERGEEALREDGYDRLRLEVFAENGDGRRFYEGRGFEQTATASERLDGARRRLLILEKPLA